MRIANSIDPDKWSEFVYSHPRGNIFQTPEMAEVYKNTKNYEPITLVAIDRSGEVRALLVSVIIRYLNNFLSPLSSIAIIQGGPLYFENDIPALKLLLKEFNEKIKKRVLFSEVRNMWDTSDIKQLMIEMGFNFEEHLNFLIPLNRTEEEIWRGIHKSRRKGINRASKKGVVVREMRDAQSLKEFYELVNATYKKVGIPLADFSLFDSAFKILAPKKMARFYLAEHDGAAIGARAVLNYKGLVYDWYAGSSPEHLDYYVNEAMVWQILKDHANKEYHTFDFGGAGRPNEEYGVREFKRRFGGKLVNFGRYSRVYSPIKMKMARKGLRIYQKTRTLKIP